MQKLPKLFVQVLLCISSASFISKSRAMDENKLEKNKRKMEEKMEEACGTSERLTSNLNKMMEHGDFSWPEYLSFKSDILYFQTACEIYKYRLNKIIREQKKDRVTDEQSK